MPLKILIIQGESNKELPSGEQTVILNESKYLAIKNDVNVEYLNNGSNIIGKIFGLIWSFGNYKKIIKFIDKYNPNVLHFHTVFPYLSLSVFFAARKKNVKIVQTLHNGRLICIEGGFARNGKYCDKCVGNFGLSGVLYGCKKGRLVSLLLVINNLIFRYLQHNIHIVNRFICVSDFIKEKHLMSGFLNEELIVNNNGIDIELIENIKNHSNLQSIPSGIVYAGRISLEKGSEVLEFLMPLSKHHAFHIIGNGPELKKLMKICSKLENSNIIFWGKTDYEETIGIISRALCTVVPSQIGEAFGLVAAESMALGVPVVSSDIGGLGHLVRSGGGQVVDARDFKQYEHAILKYLNDSDKSKLDGKKGIEYVNQNLSIQSRVDNLIDIYQGL